MGDKKHNFKSELTVSPVTIDPDEHITIAPVFEEFHKYDIVITAKALNVHENPDKNSKVVKIARENMEYIVLGEKSGYLKTADGWISKKFTKRK